MWYLKREIERKILNRNGKQKKKVERGDKESDGLVRGSREMCLKGPIERKCKGAAFERRHTTMQPV